MSIRDPKHLTTIETWTWHPASPHLKGKDQYHPEGCHSHFSMQSIDHACMSPFPHIPQTNSRTKPAEPCLQAYHQLHRRFLPLQQSEAAHDSCLDARPRVVGAGYCLPGSCLAEQRSCRVRVMAWLCADLLPTKQFVVLAT